MAIQPDILASTLRILRDREVDNTFKAIPLLDAVQRAGNVEQSNGGQKVDCPTILTEHSNITQLSTGYEAVNLAVRDPLAAHALQPGRGAGVDVADGARPGLRELGGGVGLACEDVHDRVPALLPRPPRRDHRVDLLCTQSDTGSDEQTQSRH